MSADASQQAALRTEALAILQQAAELAGVPYYPDYPRMVLVSLEDLVPHATVLLYTLPGVDM